MPQYKCDLSQPVWDAVKTKADELGVSPESLVDVRVNEFSAACLSQVRDARRNPIISRIVDMSAEKLDALETAVLAVLNPIDPVNPPPKK